MAEAKTKTIVEIRLVQVNFVPTTYTVDEEGNPMTSRRTVIGQLAFDCDALPPEIQARLREIIAQEYTNH